MRSLLCIKNLIYYHHAYIKYIVKVRGEPRKPDEDLLHLLKLSNTPKNIYEHDTNEEKPENELEKRLDNISTSV